jgi:hypothetical protein
MTPAETYMVEASIPWLKLRFPGHEMEELHGVPADAGQPGDLILDGKDLPPHPVW